MPPYLAFVDPWLGEIAADMRYGDLDGDGLPEVSVGRLTANSLAEAEYRLWTRSSTTMRRCALPTGNAARCSLPITPIPPVIFRHFPTKSSPTICLLI